MGEIKNVRFKVGAWYVEPSRCCITSGDKEIVLQARWIDVLEYLAKNADTVVSTEDIIQHVWAGVEVSHDSVYVTVSHLRTELAKDTTYPVYIETIASRGYRLIAPAEYPSIEKNVTPSESITQIPRRKLGLITLTLLILVLTYIAFDKFVIGPAPEGALIAERSIAVLPFVNMSDDPGNDYFSDGLSEEILNLLTTVPNLKVIGRTSSFAFKGKNEDLRVIGQMLGVKTLLEGSVRKEGDRVRIAAQLIDVSDGSHLWSGTYDRTLTDIFTVQDEVASAVIDALKIHVASTPRRGRPTDNWKAYGLFLKARMAGNGLKWQDAEILLKQAIQLDPNFAEAHELLAAAYWNLGTWLLEAGLAQRKSYQAASAAIAIDPNLVFAQAIYRSGDVGASSLLKYVEAFKWAYREQRDHPAVLDALVSLLIYSGYINESLGVARQYVRVDPLSLDANLNLFVAHYGNGQTDEAMQVMDLIYQMGLDPYSWQWTFAGFLLADGRDESAIGYFEAVLHSHGHSDSGWVRELVQAGRDPDFGQAYLDRRIPEIIEALAEDDSFNWRMGLIDWYLFSGFIDRYFELILAPNPKSGIWLDADEQVWHGHMLRRLGFTRHPDYIRLATDLGIVDVWEKLGPPDFCRKNGDSWACD